MTTADRITIGFLTGNAEAGGHYGGILALAPPGVAIEVAPVGRWAPSADAPPSALDASIARAAEAIAQGGWQAAAITGAPNAVRYPGLAARVRAAVDVPVVTALEAGVAALRAFAAHLALFLTPFDDAMKAKLKALLAAEGIDAVLPALAFDDTADAEELDGEQVVALTQHALGEAGSVDAVYFQGARLNPLPVLDLLETELGVPVIASNPAMVWRMLTTLGRSYSLGGAGRLFREWPTLA
jgi:maleate isomerase